MLVLATTFDGTKTRARKCRENKRPGSDDRRRALRKNQVIGVAAVVAVLLLRQSAFAGSAAIALEGFWYRVRYGMKGVTSKGIFSRAESSGTGLALSNST